MVIYKATNTHNGKCYVGLTTQSLTQRKREHLSRLKSGLRDHKFYLALRKHGVSAFVWEELEVCESRELLAKKEQHYISLFNSYSNGYNMTPGGDITPPEVAAKISAKLKGRDVHWGWKTKATRLSRGGYGGNIRPDRGEKSSLAKAYLVTTPDGTELVVVGLRQFCLKHNLSNCLMIQVANGAQSHHKGYKCQRLEEPSTTRPKGRTAKRQEMGDISPR